MAGDPSVNFEIADTAMMDLEIQMQRSIEDARYDWVDLMMQMQENNEGVEKMSNSLYFKILRSLNQDICKISSCLMVTNSPDEMPDGS